MALINKRTISDYITSRAQAWFSVSISPSITPILPLVVNSDCESYSFGDNKTAITFSLSKDKDFFCCTLFKYTEDQTNEPCVTKTEIKSKNGWQIYTSMMTYYQAEIKKLDDTYVYADARMSAVIAKDQTYIVSEWIRILNRTACPVNRDYKKNRGDSDIDMCNNWVIYLKTNLFSSRLLSVFICRAMRGYAGNETEDEIITEQSKSKLHMWAGNYFELACVQMFYSVTVEKKRQETSNVDSICI